VEILKVEKGRVYFRNPWGGNVNGVNSGVGATGTKNTKPERIVEDGPNGIESMTEEEFQRAGNFILVEK
jgi:hypothetical protein